MQNQTLIAELRRKRGWTQERLAENSGLSIRTIQRLESGDDASLESLRLVAIALEVPVTALFEHYKDANQQEQISAISDQQRQQINQRNAKEKLFKICKLIFLFAMILLAIPIGSLPAGDSLQIILGVLWAFVFVVGFSFIKYIRLSWWQNKLDSDYPLTKNTGFANPTTNSSDNFLWWKDKTARSFMLIFWGAIIPLIYILKYAFKLF